MNLLCFFRSCFLACILVLFSSQLKAIQDIKTEEEFYQLVEQKENVIANFYTTWSAPCQHMLIMLETVEKEFPMIKFIKVNSDLLRHLAITLQVKRIPTLIFYKLGEELDRVAELIPQNQLELLIEKLYQ